MELVTLLGKDCVMVHDSRAWCKTRQARSRAVLWRVSVDARGVQVLGNAAACELKWQKAFRLFRVETDSLKTENRIFAISLVLLLSCMWSCPLLDVGKVVVRYRCHGFDSFLVSLAHIWNYKRRELLSLLNYGWNFIELSLRYGGEARGKEKAL